MKHQVVRRSEVHHSFSVVPLVWSIDLSRWELFWCSFTLVQRLFESHSWSQTHSGHFCSGESRNGPRLCCLNDKILENRGDRLRLFFLFKDECAETKRVWQLYCLTSNKLLSLFLCYFCALYWSYAVKHFISSESTFLRLTFIQFHLAIFTLALFILFLIDDKKIPFIHMSEYLTSHIQYISH